jgi:hypothetical protein
MRSHAVLFALPFLLLLAAFAADYGAPWPF